MEQTYPSLRLLLASLFGEMKISKLSESKLSQIESVLKSLDNPTTTLVKQVILSNVVLTDRIILESIDFSDANYWLKKIVELLKNN